MLTLTALEGVGEITEGTDLAALLHALLAERPDGEALLDGDIVLVTSKVVSKAEGRVRDGDRESALADETARVVARRGPVTIVENNLGLVMAAAGIDASNVESGKLVLLPQDPDASAVRIREGLRDLCGVNVGVIVSDTAGRAWRLGQTDIAIGAAGVQPLESFAGREDAYGNALAVTAPAIADELSGAAELASGKLGGRPFVIARGLGRLVLPAGQHGDGARSLQRPRGDDLFALGTRQAVLAAVAGTDAESFGATVEADELIDVLTAAGLDHGLGASLDDPLPADPGLLARIAVVAFAHGWRVDDSNRLQPTP